MVFLLRLRRLVDLKRKVLLTGFCGALLLACAARCGCLSAQQLARPGWSGFHTQSEAWWKHAVFYHIEPDQFQDSNGDGRGDLRGIALRLDYLQSLGVDAILLDVPVNDAGFDDLIHEASRRHIRLILEIYADAPDAAAISRLWLTRGASGLYVHTAGATDIGPLMQQLAALEAGFPGTRLLLSDKAAQTQARPLDLSAADEGDSTPRRHRRHARRSNADDSGPPSQRALQQGLAESLVPQSIEGNVADLAASLRQSLMSAEALPSNDTALLATDADGRSADRYFRDNDPVQTLAAERAVAALLLLSRGAARLEYGQELGLRLPPEFTGDVVMPWTPVNHSEARLEFPPEIMQPGAPAANSVDASTTTPTAHSASKENDASVPNGAADTPAPQQQVFGAYHPYVPRAKPTPGELQVAAWDDLPGFTTSKLAGTAADTQAVNQATANVATEEDTKGSLLALYRRLLQLRHENPALVLGTQEVLSTGEADALLWVRRVPPGTLTASSVIVAVNLSDRPVTLALKSELARVGLHAGVLRTLFDSSRDGAREATSITLAPAELYIGEVR
jgi:glycosidase